MGLLHHYAHVGRLLLVEGIPGSGKTTTARSAARWLSAQGAQVAAYLEGDPHPADLAWQWWMSCAEFDNLCGQYPATESELRRWAWVGAAGVSVAYTKVDVSKCGGQWAQVQVQMAGREPFNGSVPADRFMDLLRARWAEFGASHDDQDASDVVVFDGSLLQNTLAELVLFADRDTNAITQDLRGLAEAVRSWRPLLVRLVPDDPRSAVDAASRVRLDPHGAPWWRDAAEAYTANTPWARRRGLPAPGALLAYLEHRQALEEQILPRLPLEWIDLSSSAGSTPHWEALEEELRAVLANLLPARP